MRSGELTDRPDREVSRFRAFWLAGTVSAIGDGMSVLAVPLLAASVTDDPRAVAGIRIAALLPWLTLGLAAGVIADRVSRRRLAAAVNLARVAILGAVAVVAAQDLATLFPVYLLVFALGSAQTLFDSAAQALLPELVAPADLERANARLAAGQAFGLTFVGPPLGGVLFAWHHAAPFVLDAASFAMAAALILAVKPSRSVTIVIDTGNSLARFIGDIWAGLRYVGTHSLLRTIVVVYAAVNFGHGMVNGIFVLFTTQVLGLNEAGFGLMVTFESAGTLLGSLLAARIGERLGTWWSLRVSILVAGLAPLLIGLSRTPELTFAIVAVEGVGLAIWGMVSLSVRQRRIPADLQGRTAALYRSAGLGSKLLGALVGGYLAYLTTLTVPFLIGGLLACTVVASLSSRLTDARTARIDRTPVHVPTGAR